jgi:hypothetical protein
MKKFALVAMMAAMLPNLVFAQSSSDVLSRIEELMRQLTALQQQVQQQSGTGTTSSGTLPSSSAIANASACASFSRNLQIGMQGSDVRRLHEILQKEGLSIGADEVSSNSYGESTASAVSGFQEKYRSEILAPAGLSSGTGFVGRGTRVKLNALCSGASARVEAPAIQSRQTILSGAFSISADKLVLNAGESVTLTARGDGVRYYRVLFSCTEGTSVYLKERNECAYRDGVTVGTGSVFTVQLNSSKDTTGTVTAIMEDADAPTETKSVMVYVNPSLNTNPTSPEFTFAASRTTVESGGSVFFSFSTRGGADRYNMNISCPSGISVYEGTTSMCNSARDMSGTVTSREFRAIASPGTSGSFAVSLEPVVGSRFLGMRTISVNVVGLSTPVPPSDPGRGGGSFTMELSQTSISSGGSTVLYLAGSSISRYSLSLRCPEGITVSARGLSDPCRSPQGLAYGEGPLSLIMTSSRTSASSVTVSVEAVDTYGASLPSQSRTVTVGGVAAAAPVIDMLSLTASTINKGQYAVLSWSVRNADSVTLSPVGKTYTTSYASDAFLPTETTTYTLTANSAGGSVSKSVTVTVIQPASVVDRVPVGVLEAANCNVIGGWAYDPNVPSDSIAVHLYDGGAGAGPLVWGGSANGYRSDVNGAYGISGSHGFTITTPSSLKDGKTHYIYAYGINNNSSGANPDLNGNGKALTCAAMTGPIIVSQGESATEVASAFSVMKALLEQLAATLR